MRKLVVSLLTAIAILAGCISVKVRPQMNVVPTVFEWQGDVALLNLVALDGRGTCSGWMITTTELVTAGHCAEQLISAKACFYPEHACDAPVALTFAGADHVKDVALFRLPDGVKKRAFPVRIAPLRAGEVVYAVGYPMGEFAITHGLYSWTHPAEDLYDAVHVEWLDHSAQAAPGSSGGVLLDVDGNLVGMTVGARTYGPRVNFERGIALGTSTITLVVGQLRLAPPPAQTIGVIGAPVITRGAP